MSDYILEFKREDCPPVHVVLQELAGVRGAKVVKVKDGVYEGSAQVLVERRGWVSVTCRGSNLAQCWRLLAVEIAGAGGPSLL